MSQCLVIGDKYLNNNNVYARFEPTEPITIHHRDLAGAINVVLVQCSTSELAAEE